MEFQFLKPPRETKIVKKKTKKTRKLVCKTNSYKFSNWKRKCCMLWVKTHYTWPKGNFSTANLCTSH